MMPLPHISLWGGVNGYVADGCISQLGGCGMGSKLALSQSVEVHYLHQSLSTDTVLTFQQSKMVDRRGEHFHFLHETLSTFAFALFSHPRHYALCKCEVGSLSWLSLRFWPLLWNGSKRSPAK